MSVASVAKRCMQHLQQSGAWGGDALQALQCL